MKEILPLYIHRSNQEDILHQVENLNNQNNIITIQEETNQIQKKLNTLGLGIWRRIQKNRNLGSTIQHTYHMRITVLVEQGKIFLNRDT